VLHREICWKQIWAAMAQPQGVVACFVFLRRNSMGKKQSCHYLRSLPRPAGEPSKEAVGFESSILQLENLALKDKDRLLMTTGRTNANVMTHSGMTI